MIVACADREVHIAGLVLYPRPDSVEGLRGYIAGRPSLALESGEADKWVLVLEAFDQQSLAAEMELLGQQPGVLSCALVYHEVLSAEEAGQSVATDGDKKEAMP